MELRWSPEPSPEEREALERALARLLAEPAEPRSAWWREGLRDDLLEDRADP